MNIQSLLESANPYQNMQNQVANLSKKWVNSGLLEGLTSQTDKNNMSLILENQAKTTYR